ncbi:MAG: hypothetical protein E7Y34_01780, partial [Mycoplasma sp.]|nr:hypothetical protein [Mycoplasma sp.]
METITKKAYFTSKDVFNRYLFFTYLIIFINALIITSYILFNIYIIEAESNQDIFGIDIKVWLPIIGGILMWSGLTIIIHLILFNISDINISNSATKFAIGILILVSFTFYNYYFLFNKYDQKAKDIFQKTKFNQDEKIKEKYWKSFI